MAHNDRLVPNVHTWRLVPNRVIAEATWIENNDTHNVSQFNSNFSLLSFRRTVSSCPCAFPLSEFHTKGRILMKLCMNIMPP